MSHARLFKQGMGSLAVLLFATTALGQSDFGAIVGFVRDATGGVVPKARVGLKNDANGVEVSTLTSDAGYYVAANLPPGSYTISVEVAGFKRFSSTNNKLDPNSTLALDVVLTVGATNETVEVVASAAPLQTESATVQRLVTRSQIDSLELNGRNPIYM